MTSYRHSLEKIKEDLNSPVSYRNFYSRPPSLGEAIRSMEAPATNEWQQIQDIPLKNSDWTKKCNGVAYDGQYWIFSSNETKCLYIFKSGTPLNDGNIYNTFPFNNRHLPSGGGEIDHIGQITFHNGFIYVAHFNQNAHVFVLSCQNGYIDYVKCISLARVNERLAEFQTINPWDGQLYTSYGDGEIRELFIHDLTGKFTGESLKLKTPIPPERSLNLDTVFGKINKTYYPIQGACFSPNGHLYISSNIFEEDARYQSIFYYSALNGHRFGKINVLAEEIFQELEGICCEGGRIYAVLLDSFSKTDDVFFKVFATFNPDIV
jgi:hypothetical protein